MKKIVIYLLLSMSFFMILIQKIEANGLVYVEQKIEGNIYYQIIKRATLPDFRIKEFVKYKTPFQFSLGLYDEENVFISQNNRTYIVNLTLNKTNFFGDFMYATAYKDINKIIYIKQCNKKTCLYSGDIDSEFIKTKAVQNEKLIGIIPIAESFYPMFRVSDHEILFWSDEDKEIFVKYNLFSRKTEELVIKNCFPAVWRGKTKTLLCYNGKASKYFYAGLNGKQSASFTIQPVA